MAHRRSAVAAILLLIAVRFVVPAYAQQGELLPCQRPPSNVRGDAALIRLFMSFVAQSSTMRRQCAVIADAPHVRVVLRSASHPRPFTRAHSTIQRYDTGFVRVTIAIPVSADVAELLAHELEHTLEAIEGVNLPSQAKVRGSGVTELVEGVYETARAKRIGRLASDEIHHKMSARADVQP